MWLADWSSPDGNSGGHTIVATRDEALALAREWRAATATPLTLFIAPIRLCDEDDPALHRYDFDHESYFALTGAQEEV